MAIAQSKITSQGQISVPADIRRKLGVGPGSVLEWDEDNGKIVLRRVGKYTFEDIHRALFGNKKPKKITVEQMDEAIEKYIREKHGRR
jgi:antitoxin PrlF